MWGLVKKARNRSAISVADACAAAAAGLILFLGPWLDPQQMSRPNPASSETRPAISGCLDAIDPPSFQRPDLVGPDIALEAGYACDGHPLSVHVARYFHQFPGHEAVGGASRIVDVEKMTDPTPRRIATGLGFDARGYRYDRTAPFATVWTWYAVDDEPAPDAMSAKLLEVRGALARERPESTVFVLTAHADDSDAEGRLLAVASRDVWRWYMDQRSADRP